MSRGGRLGTQVCHGQLSWVGVFWAASLIFESSEYFKKSPNLSSRERGGVRRKGGHHSAALGETSPAAPPHQCRSRTKGRSSHWLLSWKQVIMAPRKRVLSLDLCAACPPWFEGQL